MNGWIKLHRNIMQRAIFDNEKLLKVWIWCLCKATHKKRKQLIGKQFVDLDPGQFPTGRVKAGAELNMPPSTAWDYLKLLEKNESISINSNSKFSIVTIENWDLYQFEEEDTDIKITADKQQIDSTLTTDEQHLDTNKNVKNIKNDKKDIYILTNDENDFIKKLSEIENYPLDRKKDLEMYKTLGDRYPELNLIEAIESWKLYKLDQPLKENSNARSQINTSFKNYVKWKKCLKAGDSNEPDISKNIGRDEEEINWAERAGVKSF